MICKDCRAGGAFNTEANKASNPRVGALMRREALKAHDKCPGGTHCCCQHRTGDGWLNTGKQGA